MWPSVMEPSRNLIVLGISVLWLYIGLPQVPQNTRILLGFEKYAFNDTDPFAKVQVGCNDQASFFI
jgi:hypothetical protein